MSTGNEIIFNCNLRSDILRAFNYFNKDIRDNYNKSKSEETVENNNSDSKEKQQEPIIDKVPKTVPEESDNSNLQTEHSDRNTNNDANMDTDISFNVNLPRGIEDYEVRLKQSMTLLEVINNNGEMANEKQSSDAENSNKSKRRETPVDLSGDYPLLSVQRERLKMRKKRSQEMKSKNGEGSHEMQCEVSSAPVIDLTDEQPSTDVPSSSVMVSNVASNIVVIADDEEKGAQAEEQDRPARSVEVSPYTTDLFTILKGRYAPSHDKPSCSYDWPRKNYCEEVSTTLSDGQPSSSYEWENRTSNYKEKSRKKSHGKPSYSYDLQNWISDYKEKSRTQYHLPSHSKPSCSYDLEKWKSICKEKSRPVSEALSFSESSWSFDWRNREKSRPESHALSHSEPSRSFDLLNMNSKCKEKSRPVSPALFHSEPSCNYDVQNRSSKCKEKSRPVSQALFHSEPSCNYDVQNRSSKCKEKPRPVSQALFQNEPSCNYDVQNRSSKCKEKSRPLFHALSHRKPSCSYNLENRNSEDKEKSRELLRGKPSSSCDLQNRNSNCKKKSETESDGKPSCSYDLQSNPKKKSRLLFPFKPSRSHHDLQNRNSTFTERERNISHGESRRSQPDSSTHNATMIDMQRKKEVAAVSESFERNLEANPSTSTDSSPNVNKGFKFPEEIVIKTDVPFGKGWTRELVYRAQSSVLADVYYHAPGGYKLRSIPDILKHLKTSGERQLHAHNFSFVKKAISHPPYETVRHVMKKFPERRNERGITNVTGPRNLSTRDLRLLAREARLRVSSLRVSLEKIDQQEYHI